MICNDSEYATSVSNSSFAKRSRKYLPRTATARQTTNKRIVGAPRPRTHFVESLLGLKSAHARLDQHNLCERFRVARHAFDQRVDCVDDTGRVSGRAMCLASHRSTHARSATASPWLLSTQSVCCCRALVAHCTRRVTRRAAPRKPEANQKTKHDRHARSTTNDALAPRQILLADLDFLFGVKRRQTVAGRVLERHHGQVGQAEDERHLRATADNFALAEAPRRQLCDAQLGQRCVLASTAQPNDNNNVADEKKKTILGASAHQQ